MHPANMDISKNNHKWFVCDNNSTNGIVVNGDIIHKKI